jgi:hypothetical protein
VGCYLAARTTIVLKIRHVVVVVVIVVVVVFVVVDHVVETDTDEAGDEDEDKDADDGDEIMDVFSDEYENEGDDAVANIAVVEDAGASVSAAATTWPPPPLPTRSLVPTLFGERRTWTNPVVPGSIPESRAYTRAPGIHGTRACPESLLFLAGCCRSV